MKEKRGRLEPMNVMLWITGALFWIAALLGNAAGAHFHVFFGGDEKVLEWHKKQVEELSERLKDEGNKRK